MSRKGALKPANWVVQFNDRAGYEKAQQQIQQRQLVKGAAHLAALLQAVWQ